MNIENPVKYKRGSFEFNFCFIVSQETYEIPRNREIISLSLKKVAAILTQMELESDFLSCHLVGSQPKSEDKDPVKVQYKERLQYFIKDLFTQLSEETQKSFCIPIDDLNCFGLNLEEKCTDSKIELKPNDVPIFIEPHLKQNLSQAIIKDQNLLLSRIFFFLDGKNTILQISVGSQTNIEYVYDAIRHLMVSNIITIKPLFRFGDNYNLTDDFRSILVHNPEIAHSKFEECSDFIYSQINTDQIYNLDKLIALFEQDDPTIPQREIEIQNADVLRQIKYYQSIGIKLPCFEKFMTSLQNKKLDINNYFLP